MKRVHKIMWINFSSPRIEFLSWTVIAKAEISNKEYSLHWLDMNFYLLLLSSCIFCGEREWERWTRIYNLHLTA